jgi:predicted metallopeptidase
MKYIDAPDLKERMVEIVRVLGMDHVDVDRVECLRGYGSSSRRTIARCHTIGKLMQRAMKVKAFYAIEFLERFEKMSKSEQDKVIIHELMHIPQTFGGGFRQHDFVCEQNVEIMYEKFVNMKMKSKYENNIQPPKDIQQAVQQPRSFHTNLFKW